MVAREAEKLRRECTLTPGGFMFKVVQAYLTVFLIQLEIVDLARALEGEP